MVSNPILFVPVCPQGILKSDYQTIINIHLILFDNLHKTLPPLAQIAQEANMSSSKFRVLFRRIFGVSFYHYHLNLRIEKAKALLLENELTIVQIAYKVGFQRSQSFAKAFLQHTGQTASAYKLSKNTPISL